MNVSMKRIQKSLDGSWNEFFWLGIVTSLVEFILLFVYYYDKPPLELGLEKIIPWYWYVIILAIIIGIVVAVMSTKLVKSSSQSAFEKLTEMAKNEDLLLELDEEELTLTKEDVMVAVLLFTIGVVFINVLLVFTPLNMVIRYHPEDEFNFIAMSLQLSIFYVLTLATAMVVSFLLSRVMIPTFQESESQER